MTGAGRAYESSVDPLESSSQITVTDGSGIEYTITLFSGSGVLASCTMTDPDHAGTCSGFDPGHMERATRSPAAIAPPSDSRGCPQNGRQRGSHHVSLTGRGRSRKILAWTPGQKLDQSGSAAGTADALTRLRSLRKPWARARQSPQEAR